MTKEQLWDKIHGRWRSIENWFVGTAGAGSEAGKVFDTTNEIIRRITRYATRISEQNHSCLLYTSIYLLSINILQRKAKNFKQEKLIDIFRYILLYVIMIVCFSDDKICLCFIMFFSMISSTAQLYVYLKLEMCIRDSPYAGYFIKCRENSR